MYILEDIDKEKVKRRELARMNLSDVIQSLVLDIEETAGFSTEAFTGFIEKVKRFELTHVGLSSADYLKHPLNVARMVLSYGDEIDDSYLHLALVHNLLEVGSGLSDDDFSVVPEDVLSDVRLLTVSRAQQWDWDYKRDYYREITKHRRAALIKFFDKLDNVFLIQNNPNPEIKNKYMFEIKEFVVPLQRQYVPRLTGYFHHLVESCDREIKAEI